MRSKSRLIAVVASMLVCVAMVGTGFASWVILDSQEATTTGNVTAEAVSDEGIKLSVSPEEGANIIFGSPAEMNIDRAWLVEDQSTGQGKLAVDITVTVEGKVGSFKIAFSHEGANFDTAVTNNLIVGYPTYTVGETAPTGAITSAEDITITDQSEGSATVKFKSAEGFDFSSSTTFHITATFNWGSAFGSQNPYNFFNAKGQNEAASDWTIAGGTVGTPENGSAATWGEIAKGVLTWMNENITDTTYTITFTATQSAPNKA